VKKLNIDSFDNRQRVKITREVSSFYDDMLREANYTRGERRKAFAISCSINDRQGQSCNTPRAVGLVTIGKRLTNRSDSEAAQYQAGSKAVSALFTKAIPRTGYQILTRYKTQKDGEAHRYVDHALPLAAAFSELLAEEIKHIWSVPGLNKEARKAKIEETRARLIREALDQLPKCDTELVSPDGDTYAYVSESEAKTYCANNPDFTMKPFEYEPASGNDEPPRPFTSADFKRLKAQATQFGVDQILDQIQARNSTEEACLFWRTELLPALIKAGNSWVKVSSVSGTADQTEELIHAPILRGVDGDFESGTPIELIGVMDVKSNADNTEKIDTISSVRESREGGTGPDFAPELAGSTNFDTSLDAAIFYARDGWPVLPICQYDQEAGRCMAAAHPPDCAGKKPLVKGSGNGNGNGYTAASTDLRQIRKWFDRQFQNAGVGIRLDGHVLIDCDVKDGAPGLESYELLRDTFALPETLTAITHSGGRHYIFKLLGDLPAKWLKSWVRVLPGIDLKVGEGGLMYAEPTRGKLGVYRWIDPTFAPAILPREACDYLRDQAKQTSQVIGPGDLDQVDQVDRIDEVDQAQFFRDVPRGLGQHKRLFNIGVAMRTQNGASAADIARAMRYHAARFSQPLEDDEWIERTAASIEEHYLQRAK
jgi:putative DNA primase/helicase